MAAVAMAAAVIVTAAGGCAHDHRPPLTGDGADSSLAPATPMAAQPLPPGKPGRPPGLGSLHVNWLDPTAVSRAAITVMWTMDTTIDTSQYQAELRATPYLTGDYAALLRQHPPVSAPGAQWDTWATHRAYTRVQLLPGHDERPDDTATTAARQWSIIATPIGRDGWHGQPVTATAFVQLTRAGAGQPWRVSAVVTSS